MSITPYLPSHSSVFTSWILDPEMEEQLDAWILESPERERLNRIEVNKKIRAYFDFTDRDLPRIVLDLSGMGLSNLPDCIRFLSDLESLFLQKNRLKVIPHWVSDLTKLRELDLSSNRFEEIPEELFSLSMDCTVYLKDNPFSGVTLLLLPTKNNRYRGPMLDGIELLEVSDDYSVNLSE